MLIQLKHLLQTFDSACDPFAMLFILYLKKHVYNDFINSRLSFFIPELLYFDFFFFLLMS